jgi:small subunit ribosomal protein S20
MPKDCRDLTGHWRTPRYKGHLFLCRDGNALDLVIPWPGPTFALPQGKTIIIMANHQATKKDVRQVSKRRERNRYQGKTTRNAIRDLRALTDAAEAAGKMADVVSKIDKLAKNGVIHKNKASNIKSALAKKINGMAAK